MFVIGFIGVSSVFFMVIGVRPEVRRVRSGSMDSLWCALADVRIGSLGCALGVVGFVRSRCIHLGVLWGKSGVAGLIGVCPGDIMIVRSTPWCSSRSFKNSGFIGSFGVAALFSWTLGVVKFVPGRPGVS